MTRQIADLIDQLDIDPWRESVGFSDDVQSAQMELWRSNATEDNRKQALNDWIGKFQPCLFGRIAAKLGLMRYCVISEDVLLDSDEAVRSQIQAARTHWTRDSSEGKSSGFIVLAASERIAKANPTPTLMTLACRLCSLYLLDEIVPDKIYHDRLDLEKPGHERIRWTWKAGVNYFSAQGDLRWWQDHRIPGGIAFSTNSVGHMVKSGILATMMRQVDNALGVEAEEWSLSKVDSLDKALVLAMRTIANAADGVSGKATQLLSLPIGTEHASRHIEGLPTSLEAKDATQYVGYYHTDVTVPSAYFRPDIQRPVDLTTHVLDLTYLCDASVENPDYVTMGTGQQISEDEDQFLAGDASHGARLWRMRGKARPSEH